MENVIIASFGSYNFRRYSTPWVCRMNNRGGYDFNVKVGIFTGKDGEEGDLIVYKPETNQVYAYGQKDYRKSSGSFIEYAKWDGESFVLCDKLGRTKG